MCTKILLLVYFSFRRYLTFAIALHALIAIDKATRKTHDVSSRKIGTLPWRKCEIGQPIPTLVPSCFVRQKIANGFRSSGLERAESAVLLQETLLPSSKKKRKKQGGKRNNVVSRCSPSHSAPSLSASALNFIKERSLLRKACVVKKREAHGKEKLFFPFRLRACAKGSSPPVFSAYFFCLNNAKSKTDFPISRR